MAGSPLKPEGIFLPEEGKEREGSGSAAEPVDRTESELGMGKIPRDGTECFAWKEHRLELGAGDGQWRQRPKACWKLLSWKGGLCWLCLACG